MANVTVPIDAENGAKVVLEVCRDDEFIWFTAHELDEFRQASPEAPPTPEQQKEFTQIVDEFDRGYERGLEEDMNTGILNRAANAVARRHPDLVGALDHTMYGDRLEQLEAETEAAHEKLEEQWASSEPSSNA